MADFSNPQGTKIYFTISKEVNDVFDLLLKYNHQDKIDLFIDEWMDEYDRKEDYRVPDSEKTTISLDISDYNDSTRSSILAWGRFIMKQESFYEFMVRKYCVETLKKLNTVFSVTNGVNDTGGSGLKNMSEEENGYFSFCLTQKRKLLSTGAATSYICNARAINKQFGIDLYSITDVLEAKNLVRMFMPYGQYSDFNRKRAGAPRALTEAYVEYLEYKQNH